jgi:hypothetical protein
VAVIDNTGPADAPPYPVFTVTSGNGPGPSPRTQAPTVTVGKTYVANASWAEATQFGPYDVVRYELGRPRPAQRVEPTPTRRSATAAARLTPDPAALARPARRRPLDLPATTTRPTAHRATGSGVGAADGPGEPDLGLPPHPGRLVGLGHQIAASTVCRVAGGSFTLRLSQNRT